MKTLMKRKAGLYLVSVCLIAIFFFYGWKLTSRAAYESASYAVIVSDGNFELREYPELTLISTEMTNPDGTDGSFYRLFQYISGSNEDRSKIAMTTPVFANSVSANQPGQMSFVLPEQNVRCGEIPAPDNQAVTLRKRPAGQYAVVRFAGRDSKRLRREKAEALQRWAENQELRIEPDIEFAGYDPPWVPGLLRRNEILVKVIEKSVSR